MFDRAAECGEIHASEIDDRLGPYIGFNWLHLLTDRIADDVPAIERPARLIAG